MHRLQNRHLLFFIVGVLVPETWSFQAQRANSASRLQHVSINRESTRVPEVMFVCNDDAPIPKKSCVSQVVMSAAAAAVVFLLVGLPQLTNAAETDIRSPSNRSTDTILVVLNEETPRSTPSSSSTISNYLQQVFQSPSQNSGTRPVPTDSRYDNAEARNRAYDEAFQQDARDRDAYYGRRAAMKRDQAEQAVTTNREYLGLDGKGDVRLRVGEDRVAGMASLRTYLLQQDPSTLTPAELKVYQQMKETQ